MDFKKRKIFQSWKCFNEENGGRYESIGRERLRNPSTSADLYRQHTLSATYPKKYTNHHITVRNVSGAEQVSKEQSGNLLHNQVTTGSPNNRGPVSSLVPYNRKDISQLLHIILKLSLFFKNVTSYFLSSQGKTERCNAWS